MPATAAEQARSDLDALDGVVRSNKVGRTTVQVGIPTALVTIVEWLCALQSWDLDPWSEGSGLPTVVAGAFVAILTVALAYVMNRKPPTSASDA